MTDPRAQLADRLVAEGKSDDEVLAALKQYDDSKIPLDPVGVALQAIPFSDEIIGGASGAAQYLLDKVRGKQTTLGGSVRQGMRDADARVRRTREAMGKALPGSDLTLETLVGAATGGAAVNAATNPAVRALLGSVTGGGTGWKGAAKRVGARTAAGVGAGAVYGAGAAREGERGEGAAMGGALGGVAAQLPTLIEGGTVAKDGIASWLRNRKPDAIAARALAQSRLGSVLGDPPPFEGATVADAAANSPVNYPEALGRESIAVPSDAGEAIKREMAERAAGRGQRVMQALESGSGLLEERPEVTKRMIDEVTKPNVKSAYRAAMKPKKALDSNELRDILGADDPAVKKAMAGAAAKMKERRIPKARTPFLTDGDDVAWTQTADYNAPFIDYTKRGLDAQITSALKQDRLDDAAAIAITRRRLVTEADRLIPGYAEARAVDEGRRALINAMELGRKLGKGTVDVRPAEDLLQKLMPDSPDFASPEQVREMFRRGVADGLRRRMGRAADGAKAITSLVGNRNAQEVARLAFPDDASFAAFEQELMKELRQIPGEAMAQGAKVDASMFRDNPLGPATPWALSQAVKGNPALFASQFVGEQARMTGHKVNQEAAAQIADVMRSPVGSQRVREMLAKIAQQQAEPSRRAAVQRGAIQRGGRAGMTAQRLLQALLSNNAQDEER